MTRRQFLRNGARAAALAGLGGLLGVMAGRSTAKGTVWQIDPQKCVRCGNCATHCVLEQSAVKCVHAFAICGYCQLCTGYFEPEPNDLNTGAENCLCPTAAIKRTYVEDPYYEYTIDERLCIGCAKCVEGLQPFRQRLAFPASAARPLRELQRVRHLQGLRRGRLPPGAGRSAVSAEDDQPLR